MRGLRIAVMVAAVVMLGSIGTAVADPDLIVTAPDVAIDSDNEATVSGIPAGATTVRLRVFRPDGTDVLLIETGPFPGGSVTIPIDGAHLYGVGTHPMASTARDASNTILDSGSGSFEVTEGTLAASAPNVRVDNPTTATVEDLPAATESVELTVTRPDGSSFSESATGPFSGATAEIDLDAADLYQAGVHDMDAVARDAGGATLASGSGTFQLLLAALDVDARDVTVGISTEVTVTGLPSATTVVRLRVTDPSDNVSFIFEDALTSEVTIEVPGSLLGEPGSYALRAHARDDDSRNLGVGSGTLAVSPGILVSAPSVNLGSGTTLTVSNIPAEVDSLDVEIERPDGATLARSASAPFDGAAASFPLDAAELDEVGDYAATASGRDAAGNLVASGEGAFKVTAVEFSVSAPDVIFGSDNTVLVTNIPEQTASLWLTLTRPTPGRDQVFKQEFGSFGSSHGFSLSPADLDGSGAYHVRVTARDASFVGVAQGEDTFAVVPVTLGVHAPDVPVGFNTTAQVSGIPSQATEVALTVTRPDGTSFTRTATPSSGSAAFTLTSGDLGFEGTYLLSAVAHTAIGEIAAQGAGSFRVAEVGPAPATVATSASPTEVLPTFAVTIRGDATTALGDPSFGRVVRVQVLNPMGTLVTDHRMRTNRAGTAILTVLGAATAIPGPHLVTITDIASGVSGSDIYTVGVG